MTDTKPTTIETAELPEDVRKRLRRKFAMPKKMFGGRYVKQVTKVEDIEKFMVKELKNMVSNSPPPCANCLKTFRECECLTKIAKVENGIQSELGGIVDKYVPANFSKRWGAYGELEKLIAKEVKSSSLALLREVSEQVRKINKLPFEAKYCQNRNGNDYCGTCEQAWENCSCSARNAGYKNAVKDVEARIETLIKKYK